MKYPLILILTLVGFSKGYCQDGSMLEHHPYHNVVITLKDGDKLLFNAVEKQDTLIIAHNAGTEELFSLGELSSIKIRSNKGKFAGALMGLIISAAYAITVEHRHNNVVGWNDGKTTGATIPEMTIYPAAAMFLGAIIGDLVLVEWEPLLEIPETTPGKLPG